MTLESIDILNFKNIAEARIEFSPGANCLLGMNGMGKSNLLDAIHFLSMSRPMASLPESALMRHGEESMLVKGVFRTDAGATDTITCGVAKGHAKSVKRNGKEYARLADHIGRYPVVCATPADPLIITGPAEDRRKFMDMVISQAHPDYLSQLMGYNRALENRNRMLRQGMTDPLLFEAVEATMEMSARFITDTRREWTAELAPRVEELYGRLSGNRERTTLEYRSQMEGRPLTALLEERRAKDAALGYTSAGPHRDDLGTALEGYSLRRLGSQGQIKTFAVALRLAVFDYIRRASGITPLLLLDDIFDKLDSARVENIMREVTSSTGFGQIFITDTNRKHLDDIMAGMTGPRTMLNVADGVFTPIND